MDMTSTFSEWLEESKRSKDGVVVEMIRRILDEASKRDVSDVHFQPGSSGMEVRFRTDGVLHSLGTLPEDRTAQFAARLKVLADLLTYQTNVPQEGRVRAGRIADLSKEMRISTAPTLYGERIVVRFFSEERYYHYPDQLGFAPDLLEGLLKAIRSNGGAVLISGPAGSGKTTTAYALLRQLADRGETLRSIVTLEDPVEHPLRGVAQVEITRQSERSLEEMIKFMMRQDPEVLMVGEIRDRKTAEAAFQAALTGHLLVTTFHAGSAVDAVGRLGELGIEPFVLRSALSFVVGQRLLRKLCDCSEPGTTAISLSLDAKRYELKSYRMPKGCPKCAGTGYRGRLVIAESLPMENNRILRRVLDRLDTTALREAASEQGMVSLYDRAIALVESGATSPLELRRIFG